MQEKVMVSDTLAGINGELTRFAEMIPQTENMDLKKALKNMRNCAEMSQEELFVIARERSYYVPSAKADAKEVSHVKSLFEQPQAK